MSVKFKRACSKNTTNNRIYRILSIIDPDPYWDEGLSFHSPNCRRRKMNKLLMYQVRMYRTWKHSRKTQYKMKKVSDFL